MFYSNFVLVKRGELVKVWLAAHHAKKLTRAALLGLSISLSAKDVMNPEKPLALRLSGQLLVGLARIYERKVKFLQEDANEAVTKIKLLRSDNAHDEADPLNSSAVAHDASAPNGHATQRKKVRVDLDPNEHLASAGAITLNESTLTTGQLANMDYGLDLADFELENTIGATTSNNNTANNISHAGDHIEMDEEISFARDDHLLTIHANTGRIEINPSQWASLESGVGMDESLNLDDDLHIAPTQDEEFNIDGMDVPAMEVAREQRQDVSVNGADDSILMQNNPAGKETLANEGAPLPEDQDFSLQLGDDNQPDAFQPLDDQPPVEENDNDNNNNNNNAADPMLESMFLERQNRIEQERIAAAEKRREKRKRARLPQLDATCEIQSRTIQDWLRSTTDIVTQRQTIARSTATTSTLFLRQPKEAKEGERDLFMLPSTCAQPLFASLLDVSALAPKLRRLMITQASIKPCTLPIVQQTAAAAEAAADTAHAPAGNDSFMFEGELDGLDISRSDEHQGADFGGDQTADSFAYDGQQIVDQDLGAGAIQDEQIYVDEPSAAQLESERKDIAEWWDTTTNEEIQEDIETGWSSRTKTIHRMLSNKFKERKDDSLTLQELVSGHTAAIAAGTFYQCLVLSNLGRLSITQPEHYGDIKLTKTQLFNMRQPKIPQSQQPSASAQH